MSKIPTSKKVNLNVQFSKYLALKKRQRVELHFSGYWENLSKLWQ